MYGIIIIFDGEKMAITINKQLVINATPVRCNLINKLEYILVSFIATINVFSEEAEKKVTDAITKPNSIAATVANGLAIANTAP